jgi:hypothetical protein
MLSVVLGSQRLRNAKAALHSGWRQLCVRAQPCMHGSGDAACLLCMLGAVCFLQQQGQSCVVFDMLRARKSLLELDATLAVHASTVQ